ncbi:MULTISPECIES: ATP-dependent RecD-like DNA helicase [unclassified Desulfovibrio]|uniref:SF1B family DNA helicase RecD2 n=1 Tax=unclassified Desulfovibrio TaxID=2593640 RepID=UPI0013EA9D3C|nr:MULTISPECIES: ATP-dependent RecD-like DNA helicase [unclassified Desulfovibrio]
MSAGRELPLLRDADAVELSGTVERIVFHNEDNGFTVLRLMPDADAGGEAGASRRPVPRSQREPVALVGHMTLPKAGSRLRVRGRWTTNPRFGRQVEFTDVEELLPATAEGIRLYLSSGLIKGVGEEMAGRIVDKFGTEALRVLDEEPQRLLGVRGLGPKTLQRIRESWTRHRGVRDLLLFLQPHGITPAMGIRIHRAYGEHALEIVRENPYRLAMDIHGVGFLTADAIAAKLGFAPDSPLRVQAACLYTLQKAAEEGHVYLPEARLAEEVAKQVGAPPEAVLDALEALERDERLVREDFSQEEGAPGEAQDAAETGTGENVGVYLGRYHHCEAKTAYYLQRLLHSPKAVRLPEPEAQAARVASELPIELAPEQLAAVTAAARSKVLVITGGPGTGKTTIINAIIKLFETARARILLAAPTGRAAKRMAETSGREAKTIHRLLEYSPREDGFARNEDNPLACGLLVVDEASMMDCLLFYHLLKAVPLGATLVLVGDVHQLPSVGPGNVLGDVIASRAAPVAELTEIFRQSAESEIILNAHSINRGEVPLLESSRERLSDFYFIRQDDPERAAALMVELVTRHIPRRFGLDPVDDVQVLTPMHKGAVGAGRMNALLQEALNPNGLEVRRGDRAFRLHDKVMQVRNNYEKDVFNGDMGRITHMDPRERTLGVTFDGRVVPYDFDELDELAPAYAISIHKSQGSEYPAVVIPLMMQHYVLLQRNLVYTGVTRGKKLVILVGEPRALHMAVKNNKTHRRFTRLAQRLAGADGPAH